MDEVIGGKSRAVESTGQNRGKHGIAAFIFIKFIWSNLQKLKIKISKYKKRKNKTN